jgi:hypothetical protein
MKINRHQLQLICSDADRNLLHLGQGGGKTNTMGHLAYQLLTHFPHVKGIIAANTYRQLSDSTLTEIFSVLTQYGITEYDEVGNPSGRYVMNKRPPKHFTPHGYTFETNNSKIFFWNAAVWLTCSLDNYKAIEGQTVGYALLDETADTKEEAVKTVITGRLRQDGMYRNAKYDLKKAMETFNLLPFTSEKNEQKMNPLYIFTKPSKEQWLMEFFDLNRWEQEIKAYIGNKTDYFFKRFDNKAVIIGSTYLNVENVGEKYIENRLADLTDDMAELLIYGSPFGKTGGEYYSSFNREKNIDSTIGVVPTQPIHISFDFNSKPYMTLLVAQLIDNQLNIIDEYTLSAPRNTIEDICSDFIADYGHLCGAGLFFYGDASGKNEMPIKESKDLYKIVEREFAPLYPEKRLLRQNPRHRSLANGTLGRRSFMNALLKGSYEKKLKIHVRCEKLITDFQFVKEDANGAKHKQKVKENGVTFEKYAHCSDALDYLCCYLLGDFSRDTK